MRYLLLGPLHVVHDGRRVDIGPPKQRAVLAVLLLARGAVVSTDRLIDAVWGDDAPGSATASLQAYISNLRKALRSEEGAAAAIVRQAPGYYLASEDLDLVEFSDHCVAARHAVAEGRWRAAADATSAALGLWRGGLLADLGDEPWVREEAVRIDELHTECRENRVTALLALGRIAEALEDAAELRADEPLRERACWLHMLALYRAGRGPEALTVYTEHAAHLDAELGLRPGTELRDLQTAVLQQSPELAAWPRLPAWSGADAVVTPSSSTVEAPAPVGPQSLLVGRDREVAVVKRLVAEAIRGSVRWLVLTGPPGIGKTRLAEEAAATFAAAGGRVVWVNCPDELGTPPWWSMRQLVRAVGADADDVLQVPDGVDPDSARFSIYEKIHTLLRDQGPLAVVIDDAQWADSSSASCLSYLAGALREQPVAVIVTVRDGDHGTELSRLLATVARGDRNRRIDVPALAPREVAMLANHVAESPEDRLSDAEAEVLADRTGGNPFFVSEYARLPREEREAGDIPSAVKSVLERRLANLDPAVLQVLRAAAVIAETLDGPAVTVLAKTTRLDLDTLADHLDEAADERILISAHDSTGYEFAHGLLREQLLISMPALRRQRLHAKVAEVLADSASRDAVSRRAQHLIAALPLVEPAVVVEACRAAAEEATEQWSSDTAAGWWRAALDAYDLLPASERDDSERDALTVAMLEALGRAGRGQTVLDTAATGLAEALESSRSATAGRVAAALIRVSGGWPWLAPGSDPTELIGLLMRAVEEIHDDRAAAARVRAALAIGMCYLPDATVAAGLLSTAAEFAAELGDPDVLADTLLGRLVAYSGVAEHSASSLEAVDTLLALRHSRSREDTVIAHSVATMAAMNLGDLDAVERHLRAGIEGSEKLRLPVLRAQLRWMEAVLAVWRGDFPEAHRHHTIAAQVHERTELYEAGSGLIAATSLLRERGGFVDEVTLLAPYADIGSDDVIRVAKGMLLTLRRDEEARAEAAEILAAGVDVGPHVWTHLGHTTLLAHLCADHRLPEFAPALLDALRPHTGRIAAIGQVGSAGPVALATARLHALLGDTGSARSDVAYAQAMAERSGGVPTLLRCALLLCELDAAAGEDVADRLASIASEADRIGMQSVAALARALA